MASLAGNAKDLAQRSGIGKPRKVWLMMSWINKKGSWKCCMKMESGTVVG